MGHVEPEAANRWIARELKDENTCDPCLSNNGKLYKNREAAYADYPGGKGYVNCVGAANGNACRGGVVKRGGRSEMTPDQIAAITAVRTASSKFSARAFTAVEGPTEGLRVVAAASTSPASTGNALYLYDYIGGYDGVSAMDVVQALDGLTGDVDLFINSGGGSIFEGAAIFTTLDNYTGGTIRVRIDGVAASAASMIAMVGEEIIIEPAATMMLHAGSGGAWGTAKDVRALADVLDMLTETMAGIYAARAGGETSQWLELLNSGDTWYNAQGAIDAKLATRLGGSKQKAIPAAPEPDTEDARGALLTAIGQVFTAGRVSVIEEPTPDFDGIRSMLKGLLA